ncbi:MAG TPA: signal peptidase II [Candidatus Manganitrophaceae bacterium]|nr:signal peptidase II [Candidatus Manganitrophaceae bacterium]
MTPFRRCLWTGAIAALTIGFDQATKAAAKALLRSQPPVSFFGGTVQLLYTENPGAFLSLGAGLSESARFGLFTLVVGGFLAGLFLYLCLSRSAARIEAAALSLVLGGGISNLIDRLLNHHRVIDFMVIGIGPLRTGIFNVADVAITAGVGVLFWVSIRPPHRCQRRTRS